MTDINESVIHLRTVHFALLIVCVALYGLTVAGKSQDYEKALAQLGEIEDVLDRWEPEWLEAAAATLVDRQDSAMKTDIDLGVACLDCSPTKSWEPFGPVVSTNGLQLRTSMKWTLLPLPEDLLELAYPDSTPDPLSRDGPLWSKPGQLPRRDPQFVQPVPKEYPLAFRPFELAAPQTLKDFEGLWDGLGRISVTVTFAIDQRVWASGIGDADQIPQRMHATDVSDPAGPNVHLRLEPMTDHMKAVWRDIAEHALRPEYQYRGYTPWGKIYVPVLVDKLPMDTLSAFIDHYNVSWSPGPFEMNFPELSVLTLDTSEYNFDKLKAILQSESSRSQDDVELFGLTMPAVVIAKWGGPIMVIVQFYFILHLRAFRHQLGLARDPTLAPWIGVYPDVLSRITTAVSASALPPLLLILITAPDTPSNPGLVVVAALSVCLGAWSFQIMHGIWRRLEPE